MIRSKLFFRTIALTSALSIVFLLVSGIGFSVFDHVYQEKYVVQKVADESKTVEMIIRDNYILGDFVSLRKYLDSYGKFNHWSFGRLVDAANVVIWEYHSESPPERGVVKHEGSVLLSNGEKIASLEFLKNISEENIYMEQVRHRSLLALLMVALVLLTIQLLGVTRVLGPIRRVRAQLMSEGEKLGIHLSEPVGSDEIETVRSWFSAIAAEWRKEKDRAVERSGFEATARVANQVSHDIRSPLSALEMISSQLGELPEDRRIIIRNSIDRIRDIANSLSSGGVGAAVVASVEVGRVDGLSVSSSEGGIQENVLLLPIIDLMISEKRLEIRNKVGISISFEQTRSSYGLFSKINVPEFKRALSNLINNAVESLSLDAGKVDVTLREGAQGKVEICIKDNGKGIPEPLLGKVGVRGNTFNKEGGSGLGLAHAKETIEAIGGTLKIESKVNLGTTVTIDLPREVAPDWFVPELRIPSGSKVIVFDDDQSIHQIWKGRFDSAGLAGSGVQLLHFSGPRELQKYYSQSFAELDQAIFLMDYEILGVAESGLDLIEQLGIQAQSILVTSRYEEPSIRARCEQMGVRLIPKSMSGFVPIEVV